VKHVSVRKTAVPVPPPDELPVKRREPIRWRDEWTQFRTLWRRAFISKLRNRGNLCITLLVPPALAALIGWALHYTDDPNRTYDFAIAFHIPTYIFIALLVALFLALMNSVDDIIRDRVVLHRERNLSVRLPYYVISKFTTLSLFSAVQSALFVLVGNWILEIRGMFWPYFIFMFITAASGTSLGLVISSLSSSAKMAANFVPLVLIPQLIFGGALIKYEEMNRDLDAIYSFRRWFTSHPTAGSATLSDAALAVPLISRFVATHYTYEALIVAQAKLNPLSIRQDPLAAPDRYAGGQPRPLAGRGRSTRRPERHARADQRPGIGQRPGNRAASPPGRWHYRRQTTGFGRPAQPHPWRHRRAPLYQPESDRPRVESGDGAERLPPRR
jgi:hypothetical protein